MDMERSKTIISSNSAALETIKHYYTVLNTTEWELEGNQFTQMEYTTAPNDFLKEEDVEFYAKQMRNHEQGKQQITTNYAIAVAITAYSRILIDPFKRIKGNRCQYTDTDSVFQEAPLQPNQLGNAIGMMKNELAPKNSDAAAIHSTRENSCGDSPIVLCR